MNTHHLVALSITLGFLAISPAIAANKIENPGENKADDSNAAIIINSLDQKITIASSVFIINSDAATLSVDKKNKRLTLTMQDVRPYVTKFTAGPDRKTTLGLTDQMINSWIDGKNILASATPGAALAGVPVNGLKNNTNYPLELSNPSYDAKHGTLSFNVKWTGTNPPPSSSVTFTNVSLLIDDGLNVALNSNPEVLTALLQQFKQKRLLENKHQEV